MCGITGLVSIKNESNSISSETLLAMTNSLAHRGPNGYGIEYNNDKFIGFGHRRLSILDLTTSGKQPMKSSNGRYILTFNGEIFNFRELRKELLDKGYNFQSTSDTEVLLNYIVENGLNDLSRLNGMFAFAIWDNLENKLHLVRDRLGKKPLFYHLGERFLSFGSEIKSILKSGDIKKEIDLQSLNEYLSLNYCIAPKTMFKNVFQIMPGERLEFQNGIVKKIKYWNLDLNQYNNNLSEKIALEKFQDLFLDSIKIRLESDVPLGAFLSGGIDSTAVVMGMSSLNIKNIKTFSIAFGEKSYDESAYAKTIADLFKTDHYELKVSPNIKNDLNDILSFSQEPTADSSMIPMYYLSKMAREHVTVALSGDGADEVFGGYETYQATYLANYLTIFPLNVGCRLGEKIVNLLPVSHEKLSLEQKLKRFFQAAGKPVGEAHFLWRQICTEEFKKNLLSHNSLYEIKNNDTKRLNYTQIFSKTEGSLLSKMLYADTTEYLPNDMLIKVDRMSMAHGLEVRCPFLDHRLVEYGFSLSDDLKINKMKTKKYIIKKYLESKIPPSIINRKKAGFNVPMATWLRGDLNSILKEKLLEGSLINSGIFNKTFIENSIKQHSDFTFDNSHQLWGLLVFSNWYENFFSRDLS